MMRVRTAIIQSLCRLELKVDAILHRLGVIELIEELNMASLADLEAQVKANTDVEASAVVLIKGIAQQLKDAIASGDPTKLQALSDQLKASADNLGAAVAENTTPTP